MVPPAAGAVPLGVGVPTTEPLGGGVVPVAPVPPPVAAGLVISGFSVLVSPQARHATSAVEETSAWYPRQETEEWDWVESAVEGAG